MFQIMSIYFFMPVIEISDVENLGCHKATNVVSLLYYGLLIILIGNM